jgi:hypothetical protein
MGDLLPFKRQSPRECLSCGARLTITSDTYSARPAP